MPRVYPSTSYRDCEGCGERYRARMSEQRPCGRWCGYFIQRGRWPQSDVPAPREPKESTAPAPSCRVFLPDCSVCGRTFATPYTVSTCSTVCAVKKKRDDRNEARARRRARQRGAFVAPVYRRKVYERDGWRCHLCGKPVKREAVVPHPLAPTLDHVVPLALGGTHEPANCRTAHFLCNSRKGDRGGDEQLALIG